MTPILPAITHDWTTLAALRAAVDWRWSRRNELLAEVRRLERAGQVETRGGWVGGPFQVRLTAGPDCPQADANLPEGHRSTNVDRTQQNGSNGK